MDLTAIFKLLSDETRLRVIALIYQEELCVCELCGILEKPQPKISKVLSKLRDMDLVTDERKEKFVFYTLKKTNPLLNHTIEFMLAHQNDYRIVSDDCQRLQNKEKYIDQCSLDALREIS
jgi:ArsR family transcriptional regulator